MFLSGLAISVNETGLIKISANADFLIFQSNVFTTYETFSYISISVFFV
jgi:hypothetical protein